MGTKERARKRLRDAGDQVKGKVVGALGCVVPGGKECTGIVSSTEQGSNVGTQGLEVEEEKDEEKDEEKIENTRKKRKR